VNVGKSLILLGVLFIMIGSLLHLGRRVPWPGRLPGDLIFRKGNVTVYLPFGTSVLLSLILSVILYLLRKVK
jgi:hypothetical protein